MRCKAQPHLLFTSAIFSAAASQARENDLNRGISSPTQFVRPWLTPFTYFFTPARTSRDAAADFFSCCSTNGLGNSHNTVAAKTERV